MLKTRRHLREKQREDRRLFIEGLCEQKNYGNKAVAEKENSTRDGILGLMVYSDIRSLFFLGLLIPDFLFIFTLYILKNLLIISLLYKLFVIALLGYTLTNYVFIFNYLI